MFSRLNMGPPADGSGDLPAIETVCDSCDGNGLVAPRRERAVLHSGGQCGACHGAGTIL